MYIRHAMAGAAALAFLMSVPAAAFAAGDTSGPAAGQNVAPTTSTPAEGDQGDAKTGSKMAPAGSTGAPGVAGKKGSKSGPTEQPAEK